MKNTPKSLFLDTNLVRNLKESISSKSNYYEDITTSGDSGDHFRKRYNDSKDGFNYKELYVAIHMLAEDKIFPFCEFLLWSDDDIVGELAFERV